MANVVKMTWMLFWRLFVATVLANAVFNISISKLLMLMVALVVAIVINSVFKSTIPTFPLIRRRFIHPLGENPGAKISRSGGRNVGRTGNTGNSRGGARGGYNSPHGGNRGGGRNGGYTPAGPVLEKASDPGRESGFEPRFLENVKVPRGSRMRGTPASGLANSNFSQARIDAGAKGEINFAKGLSVAGVYQGIDYSAPARSLLNSVDSFWSVAMPDANSASRPDPKLNTDIDCVIASGSTIFLIDLKLYKGGDVEYRNVDAKHLAAFDCATGHQVGEAHSMSRNMTMAHERFRANYPGFKIVPMVVLVPTDSGTPKVAANARWVGGIDIMTMDVAIQRIRSQTVGRGSVPMSTLAALGSLVKH